MPQDRGKKIASDDQSDSFRPNFTRMLGVAKERDATGKLFVSGDWPEEKTYPPNGPSVMVPGWRVPRSEEDAKRRLRKHGKEVDDKGHVRKEKHPSRRDSHKKRGEDPEPASPRHRRHRRRRSRADGPDQEGEAEQAAQPAGGNGSDAGGAEAAAPPAE